MDHPPGRVETTAAASRSGFRAAHLFALAALVGAGVIAIRLEGHRWWCRCGRPFLWAGNIWSPHNSQHLFDPYSFTHVLHGLIFYAVLSPLASRLSVGTRCVLAIAVEVLWEVAENSSVVIDRYRHATISLGYAGDSVINSLGDVASCALGFLIAARLPVRWSVAFFLLVELTLVLVFRDSLLLSVLMLVYPIESVKTWQMSSMR